jgi:hypothetical protein
VSDRQRRLRAREIGQVATLDNPGARNGRPDATLKADRSVVPQHRQRRLAHGVPAWHDAGRERHDEHE